MKIKTTQYYETSAGTPVKTIAEWRLAEVQHLFPSLSETITPTLIIENADALVEILSHKDKGRPAGARDKAPRKKASIAVVPN